MRAVILVLVVMAATVVSASGIALAVGVGSSGARSSVVGPGESIQKAVNAAHPGDTIVVRGVHREDVEIRKNGIKLRGDDAVIEAPPRAKADSHCSKTFGSEAICVLGDVNLKTETLTGSRVRDVSISGFTIRGFNQKPNKDQTTIMIDVFGARNATVVGNHVVGNSGAGIGISAEGLDNTIEYNHLTNNAVGISAADSTETKILLNNMSRSRFVGIIMGGPKPANAKVVGNNISGTGWGIYVFDTKRGSFAGNNLHNNCAGMFFEAYPSQPVGEFEVKGNTVENNTRSCRTPPFDYNFSGIGIALLGASGMEVTGNHLSGNVPSGPTAVSGGVVVSTDPFIVGGPQKPTNNSVTGNHFGRNKPDIFWDETGSGNRFVGNLCNTSVPSSLCN